MYVFREQGTPELGDARCLCMCVFDFTVEVEQIPPAVIQVRVERDVTDSEDGPQVVYEGTLDMRDGSGSIEIDPTDEEPWCGGMDPT